MGGTIAGTLASPDGATVAGTVGISPRGPRSDWQHHAVGADGGFRFERLAPGAYHISAKSDAGVIERRTVTVAESERVRLELVASPLGVVSGWITGLGESQAAGLEVRNDDQARTYVRGSHARFGNGAFALHGLADGAYVIEADSGPISLSKAVQVVAGEAAVDFDFSSRSGLSGTVQAGPRRVPSAWVHAEPIDAASPFASMYTGAQGRFAFDGLADGPYRLRVQLGMRGSFRTFDVVVAGDTTFDVALGPTRMAGTVYGGNFRNLVIAARLVSPMEEPMVFRDFIDSRNRYALDGLVPGEYVVSVGPAWEGGTRKLAVSETSDTIEVDLHTTPSDALPGFGAVDADSGQPLKRVECRVEDGIHLGAGIVLRSVGDLVFGMPTTLVDTEMTCWSEGFDPVRFRWHGEPLVVELARSADE